MEGSRIYSLFFALALIGRPVGTAAAPQEVPAKETAGMTAADSQNPAPAERAEKAATSEIGLQSTPPQRWNWHLQNTEIFQGGLAFPARYSGPNSLSRHSQIKETSTTDLFLGRRLWSGGELHADLLMWQGFGLSKTLGIEAFPNADAYKAGTEVPNATLARLFVRHTIGLGGPQEDVPDDQLTLAGKQDVSRLTITVGRFTPTDAIDNNGYAHDPHRQFLNWALTDNLAWDYAADADGFTTGAAVEWNQPRWALRYGFFLMPKAPNSFTGDDQLLMWPGRGAFGPVFRSWAMTWELERRYRAGGHPGTIRLMPWLNEAHMATYRAATAILQARGPGADFSAARAFRYKYGFGLNWEQEVAKNLGLFSRLGWNDGQEEGWAFTDANWTASLGASLKGGSWRRPDDTVGLAAVVSGASRANQRFLEAGGLGILDGDGKLRYGAETALEAYYDFKIGRHLHGAVDYQFANNPAFNRDRGPVSIFSVRLHAEY